MKKFLIIVAHPDDELLGCGGTAAKLISEGYEGKSIILSKGMLSRGNEYEKYLNIHIENSEKANKEIGIEKIKIYNFPDNTFDTVSLLEIIKTVEKEISEYRPDIIFTHHGDDLNVDHQKTFQAVMTACRPQPDFLNPDIYTFFVVSASDWVDGYSMKTFVPNTFVNIEKFIDKKIKALSFYNTEMKDYPHSRSLESLQIFSQYWGNRVGYNYCEPLCLIRKIVG